MIVLLLLVASSIGMPFGFLEEGQMFGSQTPNFLNMVGDHARVEYMNLFEDEDLPRSDFKEKAIEWAKKHGVEEEHEKYAMDMEEGKDESKRQMDNFVKELPEALEKLREIFEDENLTRREVRKQKHSLEDELSRPTQEVLMFVMNFLHPRNDRRMDMGSQRRFQEHGPDFHPFGVQPSASFPSYDQRSEQQEQYAKIMDFEDIPRQEMEKKMEIMMENQNIFEEKENIGNNYDEFKRNQSVQIQEALENLKPAFERYGELFNNESLSIKELHEETRQIFDELSLKEGIIAQHILQIFQPSPSFQSRFPRADEPMIEPQMMSERMAFQQPIPEHHPSRHSRKTRHDSEEDYLPYEPEPKHPKEDQENPENYFFF